MEQIDSYLHGLLQQLVPGDKMLDDSIQHSLSNRRLSDDEEDYLQNTMPSPTEEQEAAMDLIQLLVLDVVQGRILLPSADEWGDIPKTFMLFSRLTSLRFGSASKLFVLCPPAPVGKWFKVVFAADNQYSLRDCLKKYVPSAQQRQQVFLHVFPLIGSVGRLVAPITSSDSRGGSVIVQFRDRAFTFTDMDIVAADNENAQ
jgi:hypothetical protein